MYQVKPGAGGEKFSIPEFLGRYPILIKLTVITLLVNTSYNMMLASVAPYFRANFHVEHDALIGLAISAFVLSETLMKPAAGWAGDRIKRTYLIMGALVLASITPLIIARIGSPAAFISVRLFDGIGAAAVWPAMIALFADTTEERHRASAMSLFTLCITFGGGIGFTLSMFLRDQFGSYSAVFHIISAMMFLSLVAVVFSTKSIEQFTKLYPDKVEKDDPDIEEFKNNIRRIFQNNEQRLQLLLLMLLAFIQMLGASGNVPVLQLFMKDVLNWEERQMWMAFGLFAVIFAVIALPAGRLADHIGKETAVKVGLGIASVSLLLIAVFQHPWLLGIAALGNGIGFVLGAPAWIALITRAEWSDMRGTVLGIVTAFQGAGAIAGPPLATLIYESHGAYAPFALIGCAMALCTIVAIIGLKTSK